MAKSLSTKAFKLRVGVSESFTFNGNYFRLNSASSGLPVLVTIEGTNEFELQPGEDVLFDEPFAGQILLKTTAAAEDTVKVAIGKNVRMTSAKVSGSVSISGTPSVVISGTPTVVISGTPSFKSLPKDNPQGFSSNVALAAGVTQIIAPAANVAGVDVFNIDHMGASGGHKFVAYIAKSTAPTSITDGLVIASNTNKFTTSGGTDYDIVDFNGSILLAAGLGLWVWTSAAETSGMRCVNWR